MTLYFKAVRDNGDNGMASAIVSGSDEVTYKVGEWTRPNEGCGPLCVFSTLAGVRKFCNEYLRHRSFFCFQCVIEPSKHRAVWGEFCREEVRFLPYDTTLADAVMFVAEVVNI